MCGRYALDAGTDELIREFVAEGGDYRDWRPDWNVAPTDRVPVIRVRESRRELDVVRWGVVPPSSPTFGGGKPIINARIETVATNGLFKASFESHRCIVPASGYYEWQLDKGAKQPYFVHNPGGGLAMAGIVRPWLDRSKADDDSSRWRPAMAIITVDAHLAPGEVHDRMPALLTPDSYDHWLGDHLAGDDLLRLLERSSNEAAHQLAFYAVSKAVNSVKNDGPELVEPLS